MHERTREGAPLLPEVGVVALVPDRWNDVWQPRHQTMLRLARYFHVVWLEPQSHWRRAWSPGSGDAYGVAPPPSLHVLHATWWDVRIHRLPQVSRLTKRLRRRRALRYLRDQGCRRVVLYIWRPDLADAVDGIPHDLSCYHIDDEYSFSSVEKPVGIDEQRIISRVDRVFIHSHALMRKKGDLNPNTIHAPNGVDYHAYSTPADEPSDLAEIRGPRILYSGRLKRQMDWSLLEELADLEPGWSFIFVGPSASHPEVDKAVERLGAKGNVHFLGGRHPEALPAYVQHADVCLMPYVVDGYTSFIYPLKLHEYLAAGKPVVSSRIESVEEFSEVVLTASSVEEWQASIRSALSPETQAPARVSARREVARCHDWEFLTDRIATTIAAALGSEAG